MTDERLREIELGTRGCGKCDACASNIDDLCAALREARRERDELCKASDEFVEAAENHRLELIVEDYVTEKTKAIYAEKREALLAKMEGRDDD
jgi:Zn-dependent alcohol dehydrogenase